MEDKNVDNKICKFDGMTMLHFNHLGKILSSLAIFGTIVSLGSIVSSFMTAIILIVGLSICAIMVMGIIFTLGLLIASPEYIGALKSVFNTTISGVEFSNNVTIFLNSILPYMLVLIAVGSITSTILLLLDKTESHTGRIVANILFFIVAVIVGTIAIGSGLI